jgi:hypothetical protein
MRAIKITKINTTKLTTPKLNPYSTFRRANIPNEEIINSETGAKRKFP